MPLPAATRLGPYEILSALGAGGMGEVYRARDTRLDRVVAIKILPTDRSSSPQVRERFEREARVISSLSHPHICALYDVGHQDGIDYLVMEYLEGKTLADRLKKRRLSLEQVLQYAIEIAGALDSAHRRGIVHRDLKPGNIMLTNSGAKVLDFGLAKVRMAQDAAGLTRPTNTLTEEGAILGTLQYMAPEQLEGKEADGRTDIFAFGAVVYEMATGKKAFEGASRASLIAAIMERDPVPLATLDPLTPVALDRVVKKCLAKDPDNRWQSAQDLRDEIRWIVEGGSQTGAAAPVPSRSNNRERLMLAIAAVAVAMAVVVAYLYFREKPSETRAVRFSVFPPEKSAFGDSLAISPDGTQLALIVSTPGKEPSLWVRRLDSLTAHPLAGTDGAYDPFWSPDSQVISFFAQGKLKKIEAVGGPAQTLCDARDGSRGSWNRDGVILFGLNDVLYRVPADGGPATTATMLNHANHEITHAWPYFLPDGRHYLYLAIAQAFQNNGVYVGSLDSKESKRLVDSNWMPAYAQALDGLGYLLFIREGTLMAQRFDAAHLQLAGKPVPVAEGVSDPTGRDAIVSVSANGTLAYRPLGAVKTQLTWFDRAGKQLGTVGLPVQDARPALSPDGRRLALSRVGPQSGSSQAETWPNLGGDIWVLDLARGGASRLTFNTAADWPVWSPDGSRIAFASYRDGNMNLYQKAANGTGNEELLLKSDEDKAPTDWSRDGRFLIYASLNPKTEFDVWVLPMDGDRKPFPFLQTQFGEGGARLSPEGQWMAYQSSESGRWEVYVRPFGGVSAAGNKTPSGKWPISTGGGVFTRWRGDGKELFYLTDERIMAVEVRSGTSNGRPTFDAGIPKPLFNVKSYGNFPFTVTADGQRFLVNTQVSEEKSPSITVILNWAAGLKP
ncbi:MAG: hypothetical protein DMG57_44750 [Acidobacteria bacterium]|nr:MAG: hypothetical protein DMG57_44750 [Acidobacteriota bacterium]